MTMPYVTFSRQQGYILNCSVCISSKHFPSINPTFMDDEVICDSCYTKEPEAPLPILTIFPYLFYVHILPVTYAQCQHLVKIGKLCTRKLKQRLKLKA